MHMSAYYAPYILLFCHFQNFKCPSLREFWIIRVTDKPKVLKINGQAPSLANCFDMYTQNLLELHTLIDKICVSHSTGECNLGDKFWLSVLNAET